MEQSDTEIIDSIFGGFRDRYGQWIYCRNLESNSSRAINTGMGRFAGSEGSTSAVVLGDKIVRPGWKSVLLKVRQTLKCAVNMTNSSRLLLEERDVFVPCLVTTGNKKLFVQVMTVSPADWRPLLGDDIAGTIGSISHDAGRDLALSEFRNCAQLGTPDPFDFSTNARGILGHENIHVASTSGHFIINPGQAGELKIEADLSTEDEMEGVESLFGEEFRKIMTADSLRSARIQARELVHGIPAGRSLTILPMDGRVQIGSMLPGGDAFEILAFFAS